MAKRQPLINRVERPAALSNRVLAGIHIGANLFQLFVLPLYLLPRSIEWGFLLVPIAALNNPFWALIHEAIHDLFSSSSRNNLAAGRLLSLFFGSPFHILRLTHLSHHKFNRSPLEKGTEMYDPKAVSRVKACGIYFFYILCGLYLLEVSSALLFLLPPKMFRALRQRLADQGNVQEKWLARKFADANLVRQIRTDGVAIVLILTVSAFCYGEHWRLLLMLLAARTFLISFMDNVYHYGTPVNVTISGHNLRLPPALSTLILNFNLHRVHHRNPSIPWAKLPGAFAEHCENFDYNFLAAVLNQLRGPVALIEHADMPVPLQVKPSLTSYGKRPSIEASADIV